MKKNRSRSRMPPAAGLCLLVTLSAMAHALPPEPCKKVVIEAQVAAGHEWNVPIGEGWVFRVVPIPPLNAGYSGWDLVVDRDQPAGFPDALYLATPPWNSINQREIGTTYSLRAQDAIGWNPRSFRFLTDPAAFRESQQIYDRAFVHPKDSTAAAQQAASKLLLSQSEHASQGELRILDAHLSPGIADPAPFAQNWTIAGARTPHEIVPPPGASSSPLGALLWMRFSLTLWLPGSWALPADLHGTRAACGQ